MYSIGIKELKENPSALGRELERREIALITKRGRPIGIALPWDDRILEAGYRQTLAIEAYSEGMLTLAQLADVLARSRAETLELLGRLGIATIERSDAELDEELTALRSHAGE
jgi:predicted HTH domain antitoxin